MTLLRKLLHIVFHVDNLMVSVLTTALLSVLLTVITRLEFMDPVAHVVEELSMMKIYYRIQNTGQKQESQEITIVDITDLSERQRDSIALVVRQVAAMKPSILGVDIIFEQPLGNVEADDALVETFLSLPDDLPVVMAEKLVEPHQETHTFGNAIHSFFVHHMDKDEGSVNVTEAPLKSLDSYPVFLMQGTDTVWSLPAKMAQIISGQSVVPDNGTEHTINYEGLQFPLVHYRDLPRCSHLITGRKVLLGAAREERDKHLTPLGEMPGIEVLAHALNSMQKGSHVWYGGLVWIVIVSIVAGYLMNAFEYVMSWLISKRIPRLFGKRRLLFLKFFIESELYDKVVAFVFMVLFTGFTYWLYAQQGIYVNTWLALGTIAFIEEGRLLYVAWLTYWRKKGHAGAGKHSLYAREIDEAMNDDDDDD